MAARKKKTKGRARNVVPPPASTVDLKPGLKVGMREIAARAGVSKMTVSRALRSDTYVSASTRKRIQAVTEEFGYVPDQLAASFGKGRSNFIAVLIPSLDNSNFSNTLRGIADTFDRENMQVLLGDTGYQADQEEKLIETLLKRRPEGIIVTGGAHTDRARNLLSRAGIPVIEMWDLPADPIDDTVGFSNAKASRALVHHLVERGYRYIGFIGGASGRDTRGADRRRGFQEALAEFGLPAGNVVTFGEVPITVAQGGQAIVQMIEQWPTVEAVMCVSDLSAFGAIMECQRRGWQVPERIAIAGFGDFEIGRCCYPSITTVSADWYALGKSAARQLSARIAAQHDGEPAAKSTILIDVKVVPRESTELNRSSISPNG